MENPQSGTSWCTPRRLSAPIAKRPRINYSCIKSEISSVWYGTRSRRRFSASSFRRRHNMSSVLRYNIQAGAPVSSRLVTSVGIPWVGVQGLNSICVVVRSNDMPHADMSYEDFPSCFWNVLVSEVEDIAVPRRRLNKSSNKPFSVGPGESCQSFGRCRNRRFGIVSVVEDTNKVGKALSAEKAIEFLQKKFESKAVFTFDKTTQTAISAFQHLFCQEFEADEIRAFILKEGEAIGRELKQTREEEIDIEECLAIVNRADV